jgi:hypothetical protein
MSENFSGPKFVSGKVQERFFCFFSCPKKIFGTICVCTMMVRNLSNSGPKIHVTLGSNLITLLGGLPTPSLDYVGKGRAKLDVTKK